MEHAITLKHIRKGFRDIGQRRSAPVLDDLSFEVARGEFLVIVGPSGSGKSTLLRAMSGLDTDFSGTVTYAPDITPADTSFVFQQFALLPWLTVTENVGLPLLPRHLDAAEYSKRVSQEIEKLGLSDAAGRRSHELSGGMRQRVGLARALVTDPKVIFMDEPFSELDSVIARQLRQELLGIWARQKPTIIMVTHNVSEAVELADRIFVFSDRPARILETVEDQLPRPREVRSADFFALEDRLIAHIVAPHSKK